MLVARLSVAQDTTLPPLQMLRAEEDYRPLGDDQFQPKNFWERIKYLPLSFRKDHFLSIGGEVRYQYEFFHNNNWGEGIQDPSGWWLQRYMLHTHWQLGRFRLFAQLQSGLLLGARPDPRGIDQDVLGWHQAFAEYRFLREQKAELTARLGRQELWYGSRRLVSVREGPNLRQSFDAVRLLYRRAGWQVDAFASYFVDNAFGVLDNIRLTEERLWGVYAVVDYPLKLPFHTDMYYLGFQSPFREYQEGLVDQTRHSFGIRWWKTEGNFHFNNEAVYQIGSSSVGDIRAYTLSFDVNYQFPALAFRPQVGIKTEIISGDEATGDGRLGTFNALYPRGAYFGLIALIGPSNLIDVHPSLELHLTKNTALVLDWDVFWRHQTADGVYGPNATLQRSGAESDERYLGHQPGFEMAYEPSRYWQLALEGSWFLSGDFFAETGTGENILHFVTTVRFKF